MLQLRPHDARMWIAMGQCYEHEQLNMTPAAIRCYHRAHDSGDREGAPSPPAPIDLILHPPLLHMPRCTGRSALSITRNMAGACNAMTTPHFRVKVLQQIMQRSITFGCLSKPFCPSSAADMHTCQRLSLWMQITSASATARDAGRESQTVRQKAAAGVGGAARHTYDTAAKVIGSHFCSAEGGEHRSAGIALHKLAHCYERGKDLDAAARCYEANLAKIDAEQLQGRDAPDALLFLANYKKVLPWLDLQGT